MIRSRKITKLTSIAKFNWKGCIQYNCKRFCQAGLANVDNSTVLKNLVFDASTTNQSQVSLFVNGVSECMGFSVTKTCLSKLASVIPKLNKEEMYFLDNCVRLNVPQVAHTSLVGFEKPLDHIKHIDKAKKYPSFYLEDLQLINPHILLYGPPGNGKTLFAQYLCCHYKNSCFIECNAFDIDRKYTGQTEKQMQALFSLARKTSNELKHIGYVIIFVDEIDAICVSRDKIGGLNAYYARTVSQFLTQMEGFRKLNDNITIIGVTNRLDMVDPAVVSRFKNTFEITNPDATNRKQFIQTLLKHYQSTYDEQSGIIRNINVKSSDLAKCVTLSVDMSKRDLEKMIKKSWMKMSEDPKFHHDYENKSLCYDLSLLVKLLESNNHLENMKTKENYI